MNFELTAAQSCRLTAGLGLVAESIWYYVLFVVLIRQTRGLLAEVSTIGALGALRVDLTGEQA